jgi:hypothetical protein
MTQNLDGKGTALSPSQLEFLSEDELVTIIPNFSQRPIQLLALTVSFLRNAQFFNTFVISSHSKP